MSAKMILGLAAVLAVVGAGIVFFAGGPVPSGSTTQKTKSVSLTSSGFEPQSITIEVGTKVVWTNNSGAAAAVNSANHPTHVIYPTFNLGNFGEGETLSLVFDQPGTYNYHNHLNASQTGRVVVKE